jgi:hypothetical protein
MNLRNRLICAVLMLVSPAAAQSFGVRGYPLGIQYSTSNPGHQGNGLRLALGTTFFSDIVSQGDCMFGQFQIIDNPYSSIFYGAGLRAGSGLSGSFFRNGFFLGIHTPGFELLLEPNVSVIADASVGADVYFSNFATAYPLTGFYRHSALGISFKV